MGKLLSLLAVFSCIVFLSGCQKQGGVVKLQDLDKIKVGMTKKEVVDQLGEPAVYLTGNPNFTTIDAWSYLILGRAKQCFYGLMYVCSFGLYKPDMRMDTYTIFFVNDEVEKWHT